MQSIATTAASSLLALVNGMDKSNKFNKLNKMQNHMSYLIAKQNGEKTKRQFERAKKIDAVFSFTSTDLSKINIEEQQ